MHNYITNLYIIQQARLMYYVKAQECLPWGKGSSFRKQAGTCERLACPIPWSGCADQEYVQFEKIIFIYMNWNINKFFTLSIINYVDYKSLF